MKGKATIRIGNPEGIGESSLHEKIDNLMIVTEQTRLDVLNVLEKKPSKSLWQKAKDIMGMKII